MLNRVLSDEDSWQRYVERKYGLSEGLPVITMDQLIKKGSASLEPVTFLDGGSLPTDMMLLAGLAEGIKDCSYFEIGTWRGESVAAISPRTRESHTLCLPDEEMRAMGMSEAYINMHGFFSGSLENVIQLRGDSRTFDFASLGRKYDLVFIDGDHHHEVVVSDTRNVFTHLVHENSVVVWHDYGFHPEQIRFEVMAAILDAAGPDRTGRVYHVAHTKCAIFTGESYPGKPAGFPMIPEEYYTIGLTRKKVSSPGSNTADPHGTV